MWTGLCVCVCQVCVSTSRLWICSLSSLFSSCSVFSAISSSGPKQWVIGQRAADQPSAACLATIFSTLFSDRPKGGAAHSRGSLLGQTHTTARRPRASLWRTRTTRESDVLWLSCEVKHRAWNAKLCCFVVGRHSLTARLFMCSIKTSLASENLSYLNLKSFTTRILLQMFFIQELCLNELLIREYWFHIEMH